MQADLPDLRLYKGLLRSMKPGLIRVIRVVLASGIAATAVLIAAACSADEPPTAPPIQTPVSPTSQPTSTPTATPTATPSPTPVPITVQEVLKNTEDALDAAGSMFFVLDHEDGFTEALGGLQLLHIEGEVTESAMHVDAEANIGRVYVEVEAILIDTDTWLTNPLTGEWELLADDQNPIGFLRPIDTIKGIVIGLINPSFAKDPTGDGDYEIDARISAESLSSMLSQVVEGSFGDAEVVIDRETYQLKSARIKGALQINDTVDTVRIIEISRYGEEFSFQAPQIAPTQ